MNPQSAFTIESPLDRDYFKIFSLGDEMDGALTITIIIKTRTPWNLFPVNITAGGFFTYLGFYKDGTGKRLRSYASRNFNGGCNFTFNLLDESNVDHYTFVLHSDLISPYKLGSIELRLSNETAKAAEAEQVSAAEGSDTETINSKIYGFNLATALEFQTSSFTYSNQFGEIGNTTRQNSLPVYSKINMSSTPSPTQLARGVQVLSNSVVGERLLKVQCLQQDFLQGLMDNSINGVGSYNYTTNLSIPNVPVDSSAFADTALVYSALIGRAPTKAEVAKITLTPDFEVRPMAERAKMIMEMPAYAARYGLAMPEVGFINLGNGDEFQAGVAGQIIGIEATSLGADDLAGTMDDGDVRSIEIYFNGMLKENDIDNLTDYGLFYVYTLPTDLPIGEYLLEVVAEDANGLKSRAQRTISIVGDDVVDISITSPEVGTSLSMHEVASFEYNSSGSISTAFLEVDGKIYWNARLAFRRIQSNRR